MRPGVGLRQGTQAREVARCTGSPFGLTFAPHTVIILHLLSSSAGGSPVLTAQLHGGRGSIHNYRVNEQIKADKVRLIDEKGEQVGIVPKSAALGRAREAGVDLVEVAPNLDPPVCRILDYGKFKYKQKKKQHQHHHKQQLKEIRVGMSTGEHDLDTKAKRVREFLEKNDKVLVSMRLRGREHGHVDQGIQVLEQFAQRFEDVGKIERAPSRESGSRLSVLLTPR